MRQGVGNWERNAKGVREPGEAGTMQSTKGKMAGSRGDGKVHINYLLGSLTCINSVPNGPTREVLYPFHR